MNTRDNHIKKVLQDNLMQIEDDSFTEKIVAEHLANKKGLVNRTFINFLPLIIGLSIVIICFGFVLLLRLNQPWIKNSGLSESHVLIIVTLSIIFLIYKWIEDITAPKNV